MGDTVALVIYLFFGLVLACVLVVTAWKNGNKVLALLLSLIFASFCFSMLLLVLAV